VRTENPDTSGRPQRLRVQALRRALLAWYRRPAPGSPGRDLPWRGARDPYAILVSEVMLQQTQAKRVAPKYREFLARFPGFPSLARAPVSQVIRAWAPLGYNQRAVRLHRVARRVAGELGGALPRDIESLRRLEGVGEYTAAAVACFAFGAGVAVVDTNVRRVLGRLFWADSSAPSNGDAALARSLVPARAAADWNQALMDLGAMVCHPRSPRCGECPVRAWCRAAPAFLAGEPRRVGERPAAYGAQPFRGSRRYYRGRIVERLRLLEDGQALSLDELGRAVKPGYSKASEPWLRERVSGLERDGLVRTTRARGSAATARVALP
jgi:A/G-specific adenine glycosylase